MLRREPAPRRANRLGFQRLVHPLVRPILLRMRRQNALVLDAEPEPPHIEGRQTMNRHRGEGHAVVGADRAGQSVLPKQPVEDGPDALPSGGQQAVTGQQIPRVLVGDGQRIAIDPIAGPELAFEVGGPEVVGRVGRRGHDAGVRRGPSASALLHETVPRQEITGRADRRPGHRRVSRLEPLQQFLRAPIRVLASRRQQQVGYGFFHGVRTVMRRATPIAQGRPAAAVVPR